MNVKLDVDDFDFALLVKPSNQEIQNVLGT